MGVGTGSYSHGEQERTCDSKHDPDAKVMLALAVSSMDPI
uniref:Uncharacterized protein n=1 Tax=Anguilla anguilla TaxID=7936 RepID=A0A0E9TED8_ANGAN